MNENIRFLSSQSGFVTNTDKTPSKCVNKLNPVTEIDKSVRKRVKQLAAVLISNENVEVKENKIERKHNIHELRMT